MIKYTLKCDKTHSFESWFQSAEAFEKLVGAHLVNCSVCGSNRVEKAIMAPTIQSGRTVGDTRTQKPRPLSEPASPAEQALRELRQKIESTSENVGREFANEARAIHDGDAPERAIVGEATPHEARRLIEDGIPVAPLPWLSRKSN